MLSGRTAGGKLRTGRKFEKQLARSSQPEDHRALHDEVDCGCDALGDHESDDLNRKPAQALCGEHGEQHAEQAHLKGEGNGVQDDDCDEPARGR